MKISREFLCSPELLGMNRESSRATMYHFASEEQSKRYFREYSPFTTLLDGKWQFAYTETPTEIDENFYAENFDDSSWVQRSRNSGLPSISSAMRRPSARGHMPYRDSGPPLLLQCFPARQRG